MKKELRKLYKIKEMRRNGLSYEERGKRIAEMRIIKPPEKINANLPVALKFKDSTVWWRRFIIWLKKLFKNKK